jgi:radical SAM superfamily enzyme YgiQ (UPF0313 family)
MLAPSTRKKIEQRLADEVGRLEKSAPERIALTYPSPYAVGMSSLGFQQIYRAIQAMSGVCCERVFLPDDVKAGDGCNIEEPVSYEALRPLRDFPVIAFSVAYELELAGVVQMLSASRISPLREERNERDPFVLAGGPLTFSNPLPLSPFVDAIVIGEAEGIIEHVINVLFGSPDRATALARLAEHPHVFVPSLHSALPPVAKCSDEVLPARSAIRTPHTELSNMFLIEAERGCSRSCQYCVMRRSTNGGMRVVPQEVLFSLIPEDAIKVGLVGAAVSDHPRIAEIVSRLADEGKGVGVSSLRPDRLKEPLVLALKKAGYRTLTTALDGISERMREVIERRGREEHFRRAAELARSSGMERLKLYLMLGVPGESAADIDEGVAFVSELSKRIPVSLGVAPFCAKRKTPLDASNFAGIDEVDARLTQLRRGLRGRAEVRATSAKWAWVEYALAQGDALEGLAVFSAVLAGGRFADYRAALERLGYHTRGEQQPRLPAGSAGVVRATASRRLQVVG